MLGCVPASVDSRTPVGKSKNSGDHEFERKPILHPINKDAFMKSPGIHVKVNDKFSTVASTKPQRAKKIPPNVKKERVRPRLPHGSPSKRNKDIIDLTQSPITKYMSPTKRQPASLDQPETKHKRSPHSNGFVSITHASTGHLCVRSLSPPPIIDLTVSHDASPIDLCSTSSSSFSSRTSTPKSSGLTSPWNRFSISTSPSAGNSSATDAKLDVHESEDFISLDVPMDTTVGSPCRVAGGMTTPVRLHTCASKVLPMPPEADGGAADEMGEPVLILDTLRRELELRFVQWHSSPEEDLRELAMQRMVCMESVSLC